MKHMVLFVTFRSQKEKAEIIKEKLLSTIYTYSKSIDKKRKSKALPKLIVNGMDDESIWQQMEIQNEESFQSNIKNVSKFLAASTDKFKLNLSDMLESEEELEEGEQSSLDEEDVADDKSEESEISEHDDEDENSKTKTLQKLQRSRKRTTESRLSTINSSNWEKWRIFCNVKINSL